MIEVRTISPQQLYKQWREGDPQAGQEMAQRFSDWYYAVTSSRLGDTLGQGPFLRASTRFQQGIVGVARESDLLGWAHGILAEELASAGGRSAGGDFPSPLTAGRAPSELLAEARRALPAEHVSLLAHAFDATWPMDQLTREADALGGMPLAVLRARCELKRWLRDNARVGFTEVPDDPNLDHAPLPLYEAGRMSSNAEEAGFEKWLLSDMALCKDIAEFGVFALALRAGSFRAAPTVAPTASEAAPPPQSGIEPAARPWYSGAPSVPDLAMGALVTLGVVLLVIGLLRYYFRG